MTTHGMSGTSTYYVWAALFQRCNNANNLAYRDYGGRGIKVCERWLVFENFLADMGEKPPGLSIDRINNDGNYELSNCRWATPHEQALNRRDYRRKRRDVGEANIHAKLTWPIVSIIRASQQSTRSLAREYHVDRTTIRAVRQNKTWVTP